MEITAGDCTIGTAQMRELVRNIIRGEYVNILPEAVKLHDINIKADGRLGFHVVTSPRFICSLNISGRSDEMFGVKVFVKNRPNVGDEYKNMQLLWPRYATSQKFHIPEPLYIDANHALLFMRYWPGDSFLPLFFKRAVRGGRQRVAFAEDYVRGAAEWLVDFQRIYVSEEEIEIPLEMSDVDAHLAVATSLDTLTRERIIDKMRDLRKSLPKMRETYVHNQYLFRNILYNDGRICVVDFPDIRIGWPLYDFFTFYTGIERLNQYPFISKGTCELMKDLFAGTYFSKQKKVFDEPLLEDLWAFFLIGEVAKKYKYRKLKGIRGVLNDIFVKRMFAKLGIWSKK